MAMFVGNHRSGIFRKGSEDRHVPRNCLRARYHSSLNCDVQAIVFAQPTAIIRLSWLSAMALPSRRHALTSPHCHALTMSFRQPLQPWWLSEPLPKHRMGGVAMRSMLWCPVVPRGIRACPTARSRNPIPRHPATTVHLALRRWVWRV